MKRIESAQNALVKHWKKLATTRKERDKTGEYVIEGFHLVEEALKQQGVIVHLMVREGTDIPADWSIEDIQLIEIPNAIAKELTETEQPQGIFAHCRKPVHPAKEDAGWKKLLFVDAVQDPGNIGTIIRTADAAGLDAVVLGKGAADPYNPKTLRSGQGSHFHIPVIQEELEPWLSYAKEKQIHIIGTGLQKAVQYDAIEPIDSFALLVGNEGSGVNSDFLAQADSIVKIPIYGQAESLNVAVATGILLYAIQKI